MLLVTGFMAYGTWSVWNREVATGETRRSGHESLRALGRIERDLFTLASEASMEPAMVSQFVVALTRNSAALNASPGLPANKREQSRQIAEFIQRWAAIPEAGRSATDPNLLRLVRFVGGVQREWADAADLAEAASARSARMRAWQFTGIWAGGLTALGLLGIGSHRASAGVVRRVRSENLSARALLDHSPDGWITFGEDGGILLVNPEIETMLGQSARNLQHRPVDEVFPGLMKVVRQRMSGLPSVKPKWLRRETIRMQARKVGGKMVAASLNLAELHGDKGRTFLATVREIAPVEGLTESLEELLLRTSGETGDAFFEKLAEGAALALQCPFAAVLSFEDREEGRMTVLARWENGVFQDAGEIRMQDSFAAAAGSAPFVFKPRRARDEYPSDPLLKAWNATGVFGVPLRTGEGGVPMGMLVVADRAPLPEFQIEAAVIGRLAQRAGAELGHRESVLALHSDKECLALTLRSIAEGVVTTDTNGRVLMINPTIERLTGWTEAEAIGCPLHETFPMLHEITRTPMPDPIRQLESGSMVSVGVPVMLVGRKRQETAVQYSVAPIRARDGDMAGFVLVFHDLTETRIADEERYRADRLESIGVLAGGIAHDFNNLLTGIVGNISLALARTPEDSPTATRLRDAENASLRAKELSAQLLTFSKGGAPVRQAGPIAKVVEETAHFSIRSHKVRCEFAFSRELWWSEIDEGQISQVVANLVINAEQAMPLGGRILISAKNIRYAGDDPNLPLPAGRYVRIQVADEGTGIPPKYLARIFDPYFTTKPKGSGLGLATSYSIVRNHAGLIQVQSEMGTGTTFDIYLPAIDAVARPLPDKADAPSLSVVRQARVLVMDDEEIICDLVAEALTPSGFEVDVRRDSSSALATYRGELERGNPYDLVILDLTLPGDMGGQEVMRRLLEMDPDVTAIVSSGYANAPIMSNHTAHGFAGMLPKPYRIADLLAVVKDVLARTNSRAA